jgi:hypothetical protein
LNVASVPTYYQEKPWEKSEKKKSVARRQLTERSTEDMERDGEAYSITSGVELKYKSEDTEIDWGKEFNWSDTKMIVDRYVYQ